MLNIEIPWTSGAQMRVPSPADETQLQAVRRCEEALPNDM